MDDTDTGAFLHPSRPPSHLLLLCGALALLPLTERLTGAAFLHKQSNMHREAYVSHYPTPTIGVRTSVFD